MALGFYFDSAMCIGCRTCHMACKDLHGLNLGSAFRRVRAFEVGLYPDVDGFRYSASCYHCGNATCLESCPVGALSYADDGTVQLDSAVCMGCKVCMDNCPFDALQFLENKKIVGKCDSCKHLRDEGNNPVCVDSCLMRCLDFGNFDELKAKYGPDVVLELPILPYEIGNQPHVLIKAKPCAFKLDYREVEI